MITGGYWQLLAVTEVQLFPYDYDGLDGTNGRCGTRTTGRATRRFWVTETRSGLLLSSAISSSAVLSTGIPTRCCGAYSCGIAQPKHFEVVITRCAILSGKVVMLMGRQSHWRCFDTSAYNTSAPRQQAFQRLSLIVGFDLLLLRVLGPSVLPCWPIVPWWGRCWLSFISTSRVFNRHEQLIFATYQWHSSPLVAACRWQ